METNDTKKIYFFGNGTADGSKDMKEILGGKGANLAEMAKLGIPVPQGFTIATTVCKEYQDLGKKLSPETEEEIRKALKKLEEMTGKKFGDPANPLLVSVRSGAAISMPGMMDTILNVGLNEEVVEGLAKSSGSARFAWDSYRRLIQMFGNVVKGIDHHKFEAALNEVKKEYGVKEDVELNEEALKKVVARYKEIYKKETGEEFPSAPESQVFQAINAVFGSWNNERAIKYREIAKITGLIGTAANVQSMVFGNMGDDCATGVLFTRNPSTGENEIFGEVLFNAQGEDVVAGIRTPLSIQELKDRSPKLYEELQKIKETLEKHYKDMQDLEFTVEKGKLYLLQTRTGKRTGLAALRIAVELVEEGIIDEKTALQRIEPEMLDQMLHPEFDPAEKQKALDEGRKLTSGLNAGPGAASGKIVFSADHAEEMAQKKEKVILVRHETSPEDIGGMNAAVGILTKTGGMTSHAALVARSLGKTCVVGCHEIELDYQKGEMHIGNKVFREGDMLSLDGTTGEVFEGSIATRPSEVIQVLEGTLDKEKSLKFHLYEKIMEWADKFRVLGVRTNADTPEDSRRARAFGAEGIGLCRTEHMFFEKERIPLFRKMIMADTEEERKEALSQLLPYQRQDFIGIFKAMDGFPVTIRLLDPPLHEFLPHSDQEVEETAKVLGISADKIRAKAEMLREANPMLGHRGCRLSITYPEICHMQARAILEAACEVHKEGVKVHPEIMIPLVGIGKEFEFLRQEIVAVAQKVFEEKGIEISYLIGTMIEIPRACLVAHEIAQGAEFFSFGTNDLTQMTFGFSRDDIGSFLPHYLEEKILPEDPFASIDVTGVGELMKIAVQKGRSARANLKIGICGEHGGEPKSVAFCHSIGLNYVSCSPPRVPIARLAAAKKAIADS